MYWLKHKRHKITNSNWHFMLHRDFKPVFNDPETDFKSNAFEILTKN